MFCHQLFHSSLAAISQPLQPVMRQPQIAQCTDDHFHWVIYELGPYITNYLEQVLLACIIQGWCARYVTVMPPL